MNGPVIVREDYAKRSIIGGADADADAARQRRM